MKTFTVPSKQQVTAESQEIFEKLEKRLGKVPNLYAMIGSSAVALKAFLVDNFYHLGYDDAAMMELIGLVAARIFTNYVYALTDIPIDFPVAASIWQD